MNAQPVRLRLSTKKKMAVWLEPWGDQFELQSEETIEVCATGPSDDVLEIRHEGDHLTIFGWSGSIVHVYKGGKRIAGYDIPVPPLPKK